MAAAEATFDRRVRPGRWPAPVGSVLPVDGLLTRNRDIERSSWWNGAPQPLPSHVPENL